jgi:hypothetical protein
MPLELPAGAPLPPPNPPGAVHLEPVTSSGIPLGAWVLLGAAIAAVIGALLPWARIDVSFGTEDVSANVNGTEGDGVITLVLGILLGAVAVLALATRGVARWAAVVGTVAAVVMTAIAIIDIVDVNRTAGDISPLVDVSVGAGLWVTLIAGLAGIIGGVLLLAKQRSGRQLLHAGSKEVG